MRRFWFAALTLPVAGLLLAVTPDSAPVAREPRFDEPGAAARHDLLRRMPAGGGADMPARYEAAAARLMGLERFSSRINRSIPFAQAPARVWT
jgi:hypothetical protein